MAAGVGAAAGAAAGAEIPFSDEAAIVEIPGGIRNMEGATKEEFEEALYDQVVLACDEKGVRLSREGNESARGLLHQDAYLQKRADRELFDVARVQQAFAGIPGMMRSYKTYRRGSYGLKHSVERLQRNYISNGDLIAAMLMRGYAARFGKRGEGTSLNAEFKADILPHLAQTLR
jgi:hypothetical protein